MYLNLKPLIDQQKLMQLLLLSVLINILEICEWETNAFRYNDGSFNG